MRPASWLLPLSLSLVTGATQAADKPIIAPPPDWVKPAILPKAPPETDEVPARLLLTDQQVKFEPGR